MPQKINSGLRHQPMPRNPDSFGQETKLILATAALKRVYAGGAWSMSGVRRRNHSDPQSAWFLARSR